MTGTDYSLQWLCLWDNQLVLSCQTTENRRHHARHCASAHNLDFRNQRWYHREMYAIFSSDNAEKRPQMSPRF